MRLAGVTPDALEVRAPATGALLGTVAAVDLAAAAADARAAQPLWSLVPASARARYIRRVAVAMLDELDDLALRIADETGWPRAHVVLSELLPAVRGLRALADDGPRALADRRLSARTALLAGRRTRLVQSPVGVIGLRGPSASPWAEPALEAAAGLLAGNGVILSSGSPLAAQRLRSVFLRAGVPGELLTAVPAAARTLSDVCRRVVDLPPAAAAGDADRARGSTAPGGRGGRGVGGVRGRRPPSGGGRAARGRPGRAARAARSADRGHGATARRRPA